MGIHKTGDRLVFAGSYTCDIAAKKLVPEKVSNTVQGGYCPFAVFIYSENADTPSLKGWITDPDRLSHGGKNAAAEFFKVQQ